MFVPNQGALYRITKRGLRFFLANKIEIGKLVGFVLILSLSKINDETNKYRSNRVNFIWTFGNERTYCTKGETFTPQTKTVP